MQQHLLLCIRSSKLLIIFLQADDVGSPRELEGVAKIACKRGRVEDGGRVYHLFGGDVRIF